MLQTRILQSVKEASALTTMPAIDSGESGWPRCPIDSDNSPRSGAAERSHARARLMKRAQAGEAEAFRLLVDDIAPAVFGFLRRRVADTGELEDVLQDTLIAVYQSRHTYDPSRLFEPWLFAIARHIGADHRRRHWRRTSWQKLIGELPEEGAESASHAGLLMRDALNLLPQNQREAFMMLKLEGLTIDEASTRAGISVAALKVRAHRAYKFLKEHLGR
jgi:RNA polymerase sigma-70 factor (ECF subfamily)